MFPEEYPFRDHPRLNAILQIFGLILLASVLGFGAGEVVR